MREVPELLGLLRAYWAGDVFARKVLLDWLEEHGDGRTEAVRQEAIDWQALARQLSGESGRSLSQWLAWMRIGSTPPERSPEVNYFRWLIDCARVGSDTPPEVRSAVQEARRQWLQKLFPEFDLSEGERGA